MPKIEIVEPSRAKLRSDKEAPISIKSSTDMQEAIFVMPQTDIDAPTRPKDLRESVDPR
jgi:hypothetical protein